MLQGNSHRYLISYPRTGRNWHRKVFHDQASNVIFSHGDGDWNHYLKKRKKLPPSPEEMKVNFDNIDDKRVVLLLRCPKDTFISNYFFKRGVGSTVRYRKYLKSRVAPTFDNEAEDKRIYDALYGKAFSIYHILKFYDMWYEAFANHPNFRIVTYEECKNKGIPIFVETVNFLQLKLDAETVESMINVRRDKRFRQGKVGNHKLFLKDEWIKELNETIERESLVNCELNLGWHQISTI